MVKYIEKSAFEKIIEDSKIENVTLSSALPIAILITVLLLILGIIIFATVILYSPIMMLEFFIKKGYDKWKTKN